MLKAMRPYWVNTIAKMPSFTVSHPDATDTPALAGPIVLTWTSESTVNLRGSVTGLVAGNSYMFHIHAGTSCEDATTQGKCFKKPDGPCPWITPTPRISQAVADHNGKATWNYTGFQAMPQESTLGHAVVFHRMYGDVNADTYDAPNTPRMACGLVEAEAKYPLVCVTLKPHISTTIPMSEHI